MANFVNEKNKSYQPSANKILEEIQHATAYVNFLTLSVKYADTVKDTNILLSLEKELKELVLSCNAIVLKLLDIARRVKSHEEIAFTRAINYQFSILNDALREVMQCNEESRKNLKGYPSIDGDPCWPALQALAAEVME